MRCIGLISGTSRDGVDAVVVDFRDQRLELLAAHSYPYPDALARDLEQLLSAPDAAGLSAVGRLHAAIGNAFASAARAIIDKSGIPADSVTVIGSHGQTVRHEPSGAEAFSLQLGDASRIALATGIDVVADFRSADIAAGGEGAPLVPPFHRWLFGGDGDRTAIVNIGGIANLTLVAGDELRGYDTGPGNTLLDANIRRAKGRPYDASGEWARSGRCDAALLDALRADAYFSRTAPKSTGFEYFNLNWLDARGGRADADTQATLVELTATTIADAVRAEQAGRVLVCGGGVHNPLLMRALERELPGVPVSSTADAGLEPDWVEACAFAWLAMQTMTGRPGNAPSVTGASGERVLGAIYRGRG